MTIALYMDEHIRRAITMGLRLRDVDVLTVQEDGRGISRIRPENTVKMFSLLNSLARSSSR